MGIPRPRAHWTPRYIRDRIRLSLWQRAHPGAPWLTADAVAALGTLLRPTDVLVEFGSGRSTAWFARRLSAGKVASVEHHAEWFAKVQGDLRAAGLGNVVYRQAPADAAGYVATAEAALAEASPDGRADVILNDGIVRDAVAVWSLGKVRPGGMIIVDNVQRYLPCESGSPAAIGAGSRPINADWQRFADATAGWRQLWTDNGIENTAFFFAPATG
jgi:predicted O-methyltransferase YrrM